MAVVVEVMVVASSVMVTSGAGTLLVTAEVPVTVMVDVMVVTKTCGSAGSAVVPRCGGDGDNVDVRTLVMVAVVVVVMAREGLVLERCWCGQCCCRMAVAMWLIPLPQPLLDKTAGGFPASRAHEEAGQRSPVDSFSRPRLVLLGSLSVHCSGPCLPAPRHGQGEVASSVNLYEMKDAGQDSRTHGVVGTGSPLVRRYLHPGYFTTLGAAGFLLRQLGKTDEETDVQTLGWVPAWPESLCPPACPQGSACSV